MHKMHFVLFSAALLSLSLLIHGMGVAHTSTFKSRMALVEQSVTAISDAIYRPLALQIDSDEIGSRIDKVLEELLKLNEIEPGNARIRDLYQLMEVERRFIDEGEW
jgi:hypothetical protein